MTAIVTVCPDDVDVVCPAAKALGHLASVHALPRLEHVILVDRPDGRQVVTVAVPEQVADQWRAALGAPAFTTTQLPAYCRHTTEVFWFGALVRLSYNTL